ncbi:pyridoxal phosphate-dependent aminotransferase [Uliginosibacterium sp. TH139]|uniref:pyridoxal phosphate-dependent aminotransferase n=1 Tax=Uliginosibacterium sp. TH139 TaxID=2067453 RepID=UPI000C79A664|nr:pyridoxal phosphate-dependent aminotransferase [Uliginosibacterium sp. TH139]PLK48882.1 aminotransferase [Uliginosibacterium sp. TH139]
MSAILPDSLAARLRGIPPFHVMELLARAQALEAQGHDIIHLEVGEPDFPSPEPVIRAAQAFLAKGQVRYTPAVGLPALREAISGFYAERFSANVDPERIIITAGASGALLLAVAALTNPGDEWLLTDPGYPCNRQFVQAFNGSVRTLPVSATTAWQPTAEQLGAAWGPHTKGLLLASPANPTGSVLSPTELNALCANARAAGKQVIVDEIYQGLVYGETASSVLGQRQDIFVVNSFSKYFGMTGWRLGWLVVPEGFARPVEMLAQHLFIAASTPAQHAALAAFSSECLEILELRRQAFASRRNGMLKGLRELGFGIGHEPAGAFYIYANIAGLATDSMEFAHRLLDQAGVACTPGKDFGDWQAAAHLRLAYTADETRIAEALERIRSVL